MSDSLLPVQTIIKALSNLSTSKFEIFPITFHRSKKDIDRREEQLRLLQSLTEAGIDPQLFDLMLSSELDRALKKQFGVAFLICTVIFTMLSYAIIILNSVQKWGITDIAITALIVETPIQFIGLLYIIARNLFPQSPMPRTGVFTHQTEYQPNSLSLPNGRQKRRSTSASSVEPKTLGVE